MTGDKANLLSNLIVISRLDSSLARMAAERKRIEAEIGAKQAALRRINAECESKTRAVEERRAQYLREEKGIKEESEKLVARRKALTTLSNYKLQEAAGREIEHAARHLSVREESLLVMMEQSEKLDGEHEELLRSAAALRDELARFTAEARETFANFSLREDECRMKRQQTAALIDQGTLQMYERIRERHPGDSVVVVKSGACSGCFIQVAPQVIVQVASGSALVKCRGCGRILYLADESGSPADKEKEA